MTERATFFFRRWDLSAEGFLGATLSTCIAVRDARGVPAVLKLPQSPEAGRVERRALESWNGRGVPRILAADDAAGVLLLERILPGEHPATPAERSPERLGAALARLCAGRIPGCEAFPELAERIRQRVEVRVDHLSAAGDPAAAVLLDEAAGAADGLCASACETALIHGDFQEKNLVLRADGELVVIDPLACRGERAFDAALAALTSRSGLSRDLFIERISARAGCAAERVRAWAAVLPAIIGAEHVT